MSSNAAACRSMPLELMPNSWHNMKTLRDEPASQSKGAAS